MRRSSSLEVTFFGEIDFGAGTDLVRRDAAEFAHPRLGGVRRHGRAHRLGAAHRPRHLLRWPAPALSAAGQSAGPAADVDQLRDEQSAASACGPTRRSRSTRCSSARAATSTRRGRRSSSSAGSPPKGMPTSTRSSTSIRSRSTRQLGGSLSLLVDGDVVPGLGFDLQADRSERVRHRRQGVGDGLRHRRRLRHPSPMGRQARVAVRRRRPGRDPARGDRRAPVLEADPATALADGVRFREPRRGRRGSAPASPVGGLRFSQSACRSGSPSKRSARRRSPAPARSFDLAVFAGAGRPIPPFADRRARFRARPLLEDQRGRAPARADLRAPQERLRDRVRRQSCGSTPRRAIDVEYGYEFIDARRRAGRVAPRRSSPSPAGGGAVSRWMIAPITAPLDRDRRQVKPARRRAVDEDRAVRLLRRRRGTWPTFAAGGPGRHARAHAQSGRGGLPGGWRGSSHELVFALLPERTHAACRAGRPARRPAAHGGGSRFGVEMSCRRRGLPGGRALAVGAELLGAGDVVGVDPRMIARVEPPSGATGFEPNYMPFVEFVDADFPVALLVATDAAGTAAALDRAARA